MRPLMCYRDTMRVVGGRPVKKTLFARVKKFLRIHSPSAGGYEYDYLNRRHIGGKKNG